MSMPLFVWTPESDDVVRRGMAERKSYTAIGVELGVSRKVVANRVPALGLEPLTRAECAANRAMSKLTPQACYVYELKPKHCRGIEEFSDKWYEVQNKAFEEAMFSNPSERPPKDKSDEYYAPTARRYHVVGYTPYQSALGDLYK